jgi:ketosteroid isomerase-like protein
MAQTEAKSNQQKESFMEEVLRIANIVEDAFNAHDEEALRAAYTEDAVLDAPGAHVKGPEAVTAYTMNWLTAFPDFKTTTLVEYAAGDWATILFTYAGTHTATFIGPDGDVPATNRRIEGRGAQIMRISGEKIAEEYLYFDRLEMMTQLGLLPEGAAEAT